MDRYYYLISQLPALVFSSTNFLSEDNFMLESEKWLSGSDFRALSGANIDDIYIKKDDCDAVKTYKNFEFALRDAIVKFREGSMSESNLKEPLKSALSDSDPLKIERNISMIMWMFLEELVVSHNFDIGWLVVYKYKLQILQRLSKFNKEKGRQIFQQNYKIERLISTHER